VLSGRLSGLLNNINNKENNNKPVKGQSDTLKHALCTDKKTVEIDLKRAQSSKVIMGKHERID